MKSGCSRDRMPFSAPRPCAHSGCSQLVRGRTNRCPAHTHDTVDRARDHARPSAQQRGYDSRWDRARRAFLLQHPLCECDECRSGAGQVTSASVVDHIVPHRMAEALKSGNPEQIKRAQSLFWDRSNWQAMSKAHHDRKTGSGR